MTPAYQEHYFPTPAELDLALAQAIASQLRQAIAERGIASLVLSGGKTPAGMLAQLAQQALDWGKVQLTLADERALPAEHPDSNERLLRQSLLCGEVAAAQWFSLSPGEQDAAAALPVIRQRLASLQQPFDVLVLGMGEDGHTASLFPCASETAAALDPSGPVTLMLIRPHSAPYARISWTLPALAQARWLALHMVGERKKELFDQAWAAQTLPVAKVLAAAATPAHVYWAA